MSSIKIVNYGPKWEEKHQVFARKYFNGRRKRVNPDYIYWKFRGEDGRSLKSFLLAVADGVVIGQLGLVPADVRIDDKIFKAQWACDLMVANEYRGAGIAKLLYQEAVTRKITLGSDPSLAATISMLKFGFKPLKGPTKVFFPYKLSSITQKKAKKLSSVVGFVPNPFLLIVKLKNKIVDFEQLRTEKFEDIKTDWINNFNGRGGAAINRDSVFYDWRLGAFKDYQNNGEVFTDNENFILILRKSKGLALVGDLVYLDFKIARRVLISLVDYLNRQGFAELKLMVSNPELLKWLLKNGFLKYKEPTSVIYYAADTDFISLIEKAKHFNYTYLDSDENI